MHVAVPVWKPQERLLGFVENNRCVAIEAPHYDRARGSPGIVWTSLEGYGASLGAVTPFPVTAASVTLSPASPHLEYDLDLFSTGDVKIDAVVAPSLDFVPGRGLRFAISLDDEPPQVDDYVAHVGGDEGGWAASVMHGVRHALSVHKVTRPGPHVLKFWMVDPGVVLERIVLDLGGVRPSDLGVPESVHVGPFVPVAPR